MRERKHDVDADPFGIGRLDSGSLRCDSVGTFLRVHRISLSSEVDDPAEVVTAGGVLSENIVCSRQQKGTELGRSSNTAKSLAKDKLRVCHVSG